MMHGNSIPLPSKTIKILRVIARLNVGGPAIQTIHLSQLLSGNGFETMLVCGRIGPAEGDMDYLAQERGVRPFYLDGLGRELAPIKDLTTLFQLKRLIRNFQPDIIHTHTAKAGTLGRLAALTVNGLTKSQRRIKLVHTFHGHVFHGYFGRLKTTLFLVIERFLARFTDVLICISESQRRELSQIYRIDAPCRFQNVALGFDLAPFLNSIKRRGQIRTKMGVSSEEIVVGIVGRVVPIKNHSLFIDAAKLLCTRLPDLPIRFIVVGDGELREHLERRVKDIGLANRFAFTGWVQEMSGIYSDLDVLALTSINEGTPVSLIEAMAASVPVVTTDAGGVKDLIGETISQREDFRVCEHGLLCPQNDPNAFAKALEHQIRSDDQDKEERVTAARDFVVRNYSYDRLVRDIKELYRNLKGAPNSADCKG